jgi:multidrug efflux pump subunit AcrA (membrane-fusion protein)
LIKNNRESMKKNLIITGIIAGVIVILMIIFNQLTTKKDTVNIFAEVKEGIFEITVANSGELLAEKSFDVRGPEIQQSDEHGPGQQGQGGRGGPGGGGGFSGGGRQGSIGGGGGGGGRGGADQMRAMNFKIQDIVPEGTMVRQGDYIAQLDRTDYNNTLRDQLENLKTLQANLEMKLLDTAVTLTNLRDEIKNQQFAVEEASITLAESKYEPPATIRQAQIRLDKAQRSLEQMKKSYTLRVAQNMREINRQKRILREATELANALEIFLSKFTITAPSDGIVIYKQEWNGAKRKSGSTVNAFDRIVATLPDLSSMLSKTYVSEIEVSKVSVGQKVTITIDALPGKLFLGTVTSVANVGEVLPNSDAKMFEVMIKVDNSDNTLRPAMTTWNKIIIKSIDNAIYVPTECVHTGSDSITFVYKKNKTRQIVVLGEMNDKNVVVRQGLEPGTEVYIVPPQESSNFKLVGENLITKIKGGE